MPPREHRRPPIQIQVGKRTSFLHSNLNTISPNSSRQIPKKKQKKVLQNDTIYAKVGEKKIPIIHNRNPKYTPLITLSPTKSAILSANSILSFI